MARQAAPHVGRGRDEMQRGAMGRDDSERTHQAAPGGGGGSGLMSGGGGGIMRRIVAVRRRDEATGGLGP